MRGLMAITCLLLSHLATAQCDDTPPSATMSAMVHADCNGQAEVTLTFTISSDDDDEAYEIQYRLAGINYTLADAVSGQSAFHTVTASTTAILLRLTATEDDDDDICVVDINQSIPIVVNAAPVLSITNGSNPTCGIANGSITVSTTGGTPPYLYSLNGQPLQSNATFAGLDAGSYTVTVRDANACEDTLTENLSSTNAPSLSVSDSQMPDSGQSNGSITVSATGGTPPYQYSLNGQAFQSSGTFEGLGAGTYTITVRDNSHCEADVEETLVGGVAPLTLVVVDSQMPSAGQSNGSITVAAAGGTGPYGYSINGGPFQSSPTFTGLGAGTYTITVLDADGNQTTVTVTLVNATVQCNDDTPPTATMSASVDGDCNGTANVTLAFSIISDDDDELYEIQYQIAGNSYTWADAVSGQTVSHLVTASTNAILLTLTTFDDDDDNDVCVATLNQSIPILVSSAPSLGVTDSNQPSCGTSNGSITVSATSGTPPYQYSLNGQPFQPNATFTGLDAGSYTVTVRDANACEDTLTENLSSANAPSLTVIGSQMPDNGQSNGSITVSATGGTPPYQYSLNGQAFQSSATFTGLGAGTYTVTVRDALGCESATAANLSPNVGAPSVGMLDVESPECGTSNGSITVSATGGTPPYQYSLNGQPFQSSTTFNNLGAGSYTVTVRDANGLENTTVQVLTDVAPNLMAEADGPVTVTNTATESLRIAVLENDIWDGSSVVIHILQAPVLGNATVTTDNHIAYQPLPESQGVDSLTYEMCSTLCAGVCDTATVYLVVEPGINDGCDLDYIPPSVVFPQGLTPNGDGLNDVLIFEIVDEIGCPSNYANSDITIFNRWGQRVFVQEPYNNNWGGQTLDGKELPPGVYYYTLRIRRQNREDYLYFGDVSIFR